MSEEQTTTEDQLPDSVEPTQTDDGDTSDIDPAVVMRMLKQRADLLGVTYSNNIGEETLRQRIEEKQAELDSVNESTGTGVNALTGKSKSDKTPTLRQHLYNENMKLVRIRIACLDPKKAALPGEIITVANEHLGTVRKFVPYGEATDDGYHVPYCIYKVLANRKFLQIRTRRDRRTGVDTVSQGWVKEFSIEVLPQLTEKQLKQLRDSQAAAGGVS